MVAFSYSDLVLDFILIAAIYIVLHPTLQDFTLFPTQVAILLISSIFIPLFTTAATIAYKRPLVVLDSHCWINWKAKEDQGAKEMLILRILMLINFPLVPAMIILSLEEAKEKKICLEKKCHQMSKPIQADILEEDRLLSEYIDEAKLALLTYKRNELSMELIVQLSIHLTMVFLSLTRFPIQTGLQTIFQTPDDADTDSKR